MQNNAQVRTDAPLTGHELFTAPRATPKTSRNRAKGGARTWYFPDGYLPEKSPTQDKIDAHEALMILNVSQKPAQLRIDFYFENRDPILAVPITVGAQRVRCIRLDWPHDLNGTQLPVCTQYAIRVRSDVSIIVQQGRIDTRQTNLSYYGSMGLCER